MVGGLLLVATLAACGAADGGEDASTSIDPLLLECGEATDQDPTWQLLDVDLTEATWSMPDGFVETFRYSEDRAVEHIETFWVAEPTKDAVPRNVLTVVVYSEMDWGGDADQCDRVPTTAVDERLLSYNETNGAEALTEAVPTRVAGLPAITQDVALPEYSYRGYWIFGRTQMVHLYCQWTSDAEQERILAGCEQLLDSVEVPGA